MIRSRPFTGVLVSACLTAAAVGAQTVGDPPGSPAAGRRSIEAAVRVWAPRSAMIFASDGPAAPGTPIDGRAELGVPNRALPDLFLAARFATRHHVRFEYVPIAFDGAAVLARDVFFNGRRYPSGARVSTSIDWTAYRVGYQYDVVVRTRWLVGVVGEVKQTDIRVRLASDASNESRRTKVPVPAVGGVIRVYPTGRLSIAGELTAMAVPDSADRHYGGHYIDTDVSGTFNVTSRLGAQAGFRSLDLRHLGESDSAKLKLRGIYIGVVASFGRF